MARKEMPTGLYTSVSQVKCWLRCPRQFELRYVRGVATEFLPVNLAFGTAVHEALAAHYCEIKASGTPLRRDLMLDVFRFAWERARDGKVPLQGDEDEEVDVHALTDKGVTMLHSFAEHAAKAPPFEVVAVEHPFTVPLHDPDTGEILEEALVGFIDLIIVEKGQRMVVEHKTAARKYGADQLDHDLQMTGYKIAARSAGMGEVGLRFQILVKTKVPTVQVADIERTAQDEDDFLRTAGGVLKAIDGGVSYPIRGWQCRGCPYHHACGRVAR